MQSTLSAGVSKNRIALAAAFIFLTATVVAQENYKLNGSATFGGDSCFTLTPDKPGQGGSVWYQNFISLQQSFDFTFNINLGSNSNGADGIAFVLQPLSTNQGSTGSDLGFGGITPSLAVEFDTYRNQDTKDDPAFDHIAVIKNGNLSHYSNGGTLAGPVQASVFNTTIKDGEDHKTRIIWNAGATTLEIYFDDTLRLTYTGDLVNDVFNGNPNVYWGFTGSTGLFFNFQSFCVQLLSFQEVIYVNTAATGNNNGTSWTDAYTSLQDAIRQANCCPGKRAQIWVAKGTYYPDEGEEEENDDRSSTFLLQNNVALYGGFAGTETALSERNWLANSTILSGDLEKDDTDNFPNLLENAFNVVQSFGADSTAVLDGFIITGGNASSGNQLYGGGMLIGESSPTISNCSFRKNFATSGGGGMYNGDASSPIVTNCTFANNRAGSAGGGMGNYGSSPSLFNCVFFGNRAESGAALYNENSSGSIINCTFYGNIATGGGGAIMNFSSSPIITNAIIWGNTAAVGSTIVNIENSSPPTTYSVIEEGTFGEGNLINNPLFVDAANGNFSLQPCSPAINSGDNSANSTSVDVAGNTRKSGTIDRGAYEYQGPPATAPILTNQPLYVQAICQSTTAAPLTVSASDTGLAYQWYSNSKNSNSGGTTINGATEATFAPPSDSAGVMYYYAVVSNTCDSTVSQVAEVVVRQKSITTEASASIPVICQGDSTQLILHGTTGDGAVIRWYADVNGTTLIGSNNGLSVSPTVTTTYYGRFEDPAPCDTYSEIKQVTITVTPPLTVYRDADGDTFGDPAVTQSVCSAIPPAGYVTDNTDCNDNDSTERPNQTWYIDADGDGYGTGNFIQQCQRPATGYLASELVALSGDCNDTNGNIYPATVVYVNASASGKNNGTSWQHAYTSLQDVLVNFAPCDNAAAIQIWMAKGTYFPDEGSGQTANDRNASFILKNKFAFYGGFAGTETQLSQRNWQTNVTTLSGDLLNNDGLDFTNTGDNSLHVVQSSRVDSTAILDGFTIRGGSELGGGMYNDSSSATILNCTFTGNKSIAGAAMFNLFSSPTLRNCSFIGNVADFYGGGMYNYGSSPLLFNCSFENNRAYTGGGINNDFSSSPSFTNCRFVRNIAGREGGALNNVSSSPNLVNCSLFGNRAVEGGGINNDGSLPVVTNSILWSNVASTAATAEIAGAATVTHSLVRGGYAGTNNIMANPLFVDTLTGDLRLRPCSPAINKGLSGINTTPLDLAGNPRVMGDTIDIGAYEFQGTSCANIPLPVTFVSLTALPTGEDVWLTWIVAAEHNIVRYVVEHSADGHTFISLGEVKAANKENYSFLHGRAGAGLHYYRIRSQESDGSSRYSQVVKAVIGRVAGYFVVAPNPVEGQHFNVQFNAQPQGRYKVRLVSSNGQALFSTIIQHAGGYSSYSLPLPKLFAAGIYQLEIQLPSGEIKTHKLLRQ